MSCPIETLLSQGKSFEALADRDQLVVLAFYCNQFTGQAPSTDQSYAGLGERDQWIIMATLLGQIGNSIVSGTADVPDPSTMLSDAKDCQGASFYDQDTAIVQQCCNVP